MYSIIHTESDTNLVTTTDSLDETVPGASIWSPAENSASIACLGALLLGPLLIFISISGAGLAGLGNLLIGVPIWLLSALTLSLIAISLKEPAGPVALCLTLLPIFGVLSLFS